MEFRENVPLAPQTTFRIGGPARFFCRAASVDDLREAQRFANEHDLPLLILGGGSNVLVADTGFAGLVVQNAIVGIEKAEEGNDVLLTVGAGESWDALVETAVENGWWGIENLSGIPGSVGATPMQNVGAYGAEVADVIEWVEGYDRGSGVLKILTPDECLFGYRDSYFKRHPEQYIITRVAYRLKKNGVINDTYKDISVYFTKHHIVNRSLRDVRDAVLSIRARKTPDAETFGTAGSFFKNPVISNEQYKKLQQRFPGIPGRAVGSDDIKVPAAWLIEHVAGAKGARHGAVEAWRKQPLMLAAKGGASAEEVRAFAHALQQAIKEKTNIMLEREITYIGF